VEVNVIEAPTCSAESGETVDEERPQCEPQNPAETKLLPLEQFQEGLAQNEIYFNAPEQCDVCKTTLTGKRFMVDGNFEPGGCLWGCMCAKCFLKVGEGIGWGKGQLYTKLKNGEWLMTAGFRPADDSPDQETPLRDVPAPSQFDSQQSSNSDTIDDLIEAIAEEDEMLAVRIVRRSPHLLSTNPDARVDPCGMPLLHVACEMNFPILAEALIDAGVNIDEDGYGPDYRCPPLHTAFHENSCECVNLLIARSAPLGLGGNLNFLHVAAYYQDTDLALAILQHGGIQPDIFTAVAFGFVEEVERLVCESRWLAFEQIYSPTYVNDHFGMGETPLHWAARFCCKAIPVLLRAGAEIDAVDIFGSTPLRWAVDDCASAAVQEMLAYGASQSVPSRRCKSMPMDQARHMKAHAADQDDQNAWQGIIDLLQKYNRQNESQRQPPD